MATASDSSPIKAPTGKENFAQHSGKLKAMENNDDDEVLTDPSHNQDGSEFVVSEDESSDDGNSTDPDAAFTDYEQKQTKWNRPTPEGARRSHRNKEEEDEDDAAANGNGNGNGTPNDDNNTATAQDEEEEDDDEYYLSPNSVVLKRDVSDEQVEADLDEIRGMWEMASIHDFLRLFKPQLKISRDVGPDELEHVLVTSPGDGGLLADIHMDLMKGTSPKNPIIVANWITHLANKIKHHWKHIPMSGFGCPFKPDKYYEAVTYSRLSSVNRVRALHFLCCLRADRPDIAGRISDADRPKTKKELAGVAKAAAAALKGSRNNLNEESSPAPPTIEEVDNFRLSPIGVDSSKIAYYFFTCHDNTGFRLYRELPPSIRSNSSRRKSLDDEIFIEATDDDSDSDEDSLDDYEVPDYPPGGKWELVATTLGELEAIAERLNRSMKAVDKALALKLTTDIMSEIHERLEAEERRIKAAQRVQRRLGVDSAGAVDEGLRPRRSRAVVNYAFTEYDDMLRSAIRRSQRGGPVDEPDGKRRRAYSPSYYDPIDEAIHGLRRGRSAAALKAGEPSVELDERKLRMQKLSNRREDGVYYNEDEDDDNDEREEERAGNVGTAREDDDGDSPVDDDEVLETE
jgi:hypothetical protein